MENLYIVYWYKVLCGWLIYISLLYSLVEATCCRIHVTENVEGNVLWDNRQIIYYIWVWGIIWVIFGYLCLLLRCLGRNDAPLQRPFCHRMIGRKYIEAWSVKQNMKKKLHLYREKGILWVICICLPSGFLGRNDASLRLPFCHGRIDQICRGAWSAKIMEICIVLWY